MPLPPHPPPTLPGTRPAAGAADPHQRSRESSGYSRHCATLQRREGALATASKFTREGLFPHWIYHERAQPLPDDHLQRSTLTTFPKPLRVLWLIPSPSLVEGSLAAISRNSLRCLRAVSGRGCVARAEACSELITDSRWSNVEHSCVCERERERMAPWSSTV